MTNLLDNSGKLPERVPKRLRDREERMAYKRLRLLLAEAGFDSRTGLEAVLVACSQLARLVKMRAEVDALPSYATVNSSGTRVIDPLVREIRSLEAQVNASLGGLLLTPRAKSVARAKPEQDGPPGDSMLGMLGLGGGV